MSSRKEIGELVTIASNSNNASAAIPIGFTIVIDEWNYPIRTGVIVDRRNAGWLAKQLADDLYHKTAEYYKYMSEAGAKKDLAQSIEFDIHVVLNQLNVQHLSCENCGKDEQDHVNGGWCPNQTETKGTRKFEEKK